MPPTIHEPARNTPVIGEYDVLVAGGGIAGVAAAAAAARNGATTCLLEKESALGGLATLGNVVKYLPLCDGRGNQIVGGLGEELAQISLHDGAAEVPNCWREGGEVADRDGTRYVVTYQPASYMLELEQLVVEAGVDLLYDTRVCDVSRDGDRIQAILIENKGGRSALRCRTVVDASGDADLCAQAGEETVSHRTNVAGGWFHYWNGERLVLHPMTKHFEFDPRSPNEGVNGYAGDDGHDATGQILESREMIRERLTKLRAESPDTPLYPVFIPTIATYRMTRRLKGALELQVEHAGEYFEDTVGMTGHWRKKGPVYCLPLRCLMGVRTENLLTAGRCISSVGECWDITRVIAPCAVTGEAAGVAAAVAARDHGGRVADLDLAALQRGLAAQGVILDRGLVRG